MALLLHVKHVRHVVSYISYVSYFADLHWFFWSYLIASAASTNIRLQRSKAIGSPQPHSFASVFVWLPSSLHWGTELQQHLNHEIFTNHPPSTATKIIWLWWFYAYGVSASCVISKEKSFFCRMGDLYILNTRCQLTTTIKEAFEGAGYKVRTA